MVKSSNPREHVGANSGDVGGIAADRLKTFVDRIEKKEAEKKEISDDIKDDYAEAKGTGFDPAIIRKIIAERKREQEDIDEERELMDLYRSALGSSRRNPKGDTEGL